MKKNLADLKSSGAESGGTVTPPVELIQSKQKKFLVSKLSLAIKGLPADFEGYKLLQLSDLHYGPSTSLKHLTTAVLLANSLKPDLILLTGDYIQSNRHGTGDPWAQILGPTPSRHRRHRRKVQRLASELDTALSLLESRHGILAVYGNHDIREGAQVIARYLRSDIVWLKNNSFSLNSRTGALQFVGLDDYRLGKPNLPRALQVVTRAVYTEEDATNENASVTKILLSHNPDFVIGANPHLLEGFELALCGHTHGGQICLPGGRPIITRAKQGKHRRGLSFEKNLPVYVTNGIGYGAIGIRSFCPPELVLITLTGR